MSKSWISSKAFSARAWIVGSFGMSLHLFISWCSSACSCGDGPKILSGCAVRTLGRTTCRTSCGCAPSCAQASRSMVHAPQSALLT